MDLGPDRFYRHILDQLTDGVYVLGRDRRIQYWNRAAERISGFRAEEVMGRAPPRRGASHHRAVLANLDRPALSHATDRLRILVEESRLVLGETMVRVTISAGATIVKPEDTIASAIERSDALLYRSKAAGRNRISCDP